MRFYKSSEIAKKVARTEVSYYRYTHKTEIFYQPHLFKVKRTTHKERLIDFCVLLRQNSQKVQEMNLQSNEEALTILQEKDNPLEIQHTEIEVNQIYVTLWIERNKHTWYIGHCIGNNDGGTYKIEHLHRVNKLSNLKWKNPTFPDISDVNPKNIFIHQIDADWDFSNHRNLTFTLKNHESIGNLVKDLLLMTYTQLVSAFIKISIFHLIFGQFSFRLTSACLRTK